MKLTLSEDFYTLLSKKHLLLDTSFFGEYAKYPKQFSKLVDDMKKSDVHLLTINGVRTEFAMLSKSEADIEKYYELIDQIVDKVLEEQAFIRSGILDKTLKFYIKNIKKVTSLGNVSFTDILLSATACAFNGEVFLLSKNFNDFPFEVIADITIYKSNKIESYAVYDTKNLLN